MRLYLQMPAPQGRPPRFYQLVLQRDLFGGWSLIREWGRQGAGGRSLREYFPARDEAVTAMMRIRDDQLRRGYRLVYAEGEHPRE